MIITDKARDSIIQIMKKQDLDPRIFFLYFCIPDGQEGCAINFTKDEEIGKQYQFGELKVTVALEINSDELMIDLSEVENRVGLIFKGK